MDQEIGDQKTKKKTILRVGKKSKRFVFTNRDQKALKWVAEQGVATVEQLWWAVWKDAESKSSKYAEERLRAMAQGGYLKRERVFGSGTTNYMISQKGRNLINEVYPDRRDFLPPVPKRVNDGQYRHTMALNWSRIFLEQDPSVDCWMSDRAVQSWLKRRENKGSRDQFEKIDQISPDACFEYLGEQWLFEYEATQKNKKKYEEKARFLFGFQYQLIRGLIFVAATANLKAILKKHFMSSECFIFTFDELKEGKVLSFLHQKNREKLEREHYFSQKKLEKEARLPSLQSKLEGWLRERKHLKAQIEEAEKEVQQASLALHQFENGLIKIPFQREKLLEKVQFFNHKLRELRTQDQNMYDQISQLKNEIKKLGIS